MGKVRRSRAANRDITEIMRYIAQSSLKAALDWFDAIDAEFKKLSDFPGIGRIRTDLGSDLLSTHVESYVVIYRRISGGIQVVRVYHGSQNYEKDFK